MIQHVGGMPEGSTIAKLHPTDRQQSKNIPDYEIAPSHGMQQLVGMKNVPLLPCGGKSVSGFHRFRTESVQ